MAALDEADLVSGLRQGDRNAQRAFWDQNIDPLTGWIHSLGIRSEQDVEEIACNAFRRAFKSIGRFRGRCKLQTWLFRLARNAQIDYYRSPKNHSIASIRDISQTDDYWVKHNGNFKKNPPSDDSENGGHRNPVKDACSPTLDALVNEERREKVRRMLDTLSPDQREVFYLRWMEEMSVGETAAILKISEGAVKMRTSRAFAALQGGIKGNPYFAVSGRQKEVTIS